MPKPQQIIQGFTINRRGEASITDDLAKVLDSYKQSVAEVTGLAIELEHVLAALVLASRSNVLSSDHRLTQDDFATQTKLIPFVKGVFEGDN